MTARDGTGPAATRRARAAAHVHSEWSDDASWPLDRIAAMFSRLRCDVVLMSEHSRGFSAARWAEYVAACREASTSRLTLVPGIEYGDADNVVHIPVWGDVPYFGDGGPIGKLLPAVSEAGGVAVWAHPYRREAWRRFDASWLDHLGAVEVWNRKYDGIAPNAAAFRLACREGLPAFASLDFHSARQIFPLSLPLDVRAGPGPPRATAVFEALAAGRFSARALGLPVAAVARGPGRVALQGLERLRRVTASGVGTFSGGSR